METVTEEEKADALPQIWLKRLTWRSRAYSMWELNSAARAHNSAFILNLGLNRSHGPD